MAESSGTVVLLTQLGTPDAPETGAVRRYLRQFLADPRVVEIPRIVWLPILYGVILNIRPAKSAKKYASIWTPDGSPLAVYTERQAKLLRGYLGQAGHQVEVAWAMRYGNPSIPSVLEKLRSQGMRRLLVLPMYPQYSAATTASTQDAVFDTIRRWRNQPDLRVLRGFNGHPAYIEALAKRLERHWGTGLRPARTLFSFHGLPQRSVDLGDPYFEECQQTARRLARRLGLQEGQWASSFQSRFGKARWLQPYTTATLEAWGKAGVSGVDVYCPGFVADCLETLEEIAMEAKADFEAAGGKEFRYVPALNDSPEWIAALATIALEQLAGWPTGPAQKTTAQSV